MSDLLLATTNPGKLAELRVLLADAPCRLLSVADVGLDALEVEEDGDSLEANATIKARAYARAGGLPALADDTGLFVDALGGAPGIHAARYGGPGLTMAQRRAHLLAALADVPAPDRTAHFACIIALANPATDTVQMAYGEVRGHIAVAEDSGGEGFGYDALFIPDGWDISFSRLPAADKNQISHRGRAAQAALPLLRALC